MLRRVLPHFNLGREANLAPLVSWWSAFVPSPGVRSP